MNWDSLTPCRTFRLKLHSNEMTHQQKHVNLPSMPRCLGKNLVLPVLSYQYLHSAANWVYSSVYSWYIGYSLLMIANKNKIHRYRTKCIWPTLYAASKRTECIWPSQYVPFTGTECISPSQYVALTTGTKCIWPSHYAASTSRKFIWST